MAPSATQEQGSTLLTAYDLHLFNEGKHSRLFEKFGAHVIEHDGRRGTYFAVWAPNADRISVVGDFNGWNPDSHPMNPRESSGAWEAFIPGLGQGTVYKYHLRSRYHMYTVDKTDPYGYYNEVPPKTASIVRELDYEWGDKEWMRTRQSRNKFDAPMSTYEVHLGSWMRVPEEGNRSLTYRELAVKLADYVSEMGFTHVEFMPVMEHPFFGSWGYQITGYFAPSARFGTPQDFMYLVDYLHQRGIGVILDWVPSHFPNDEHGLAYFDGTHLYEHADPRKGFHPDWKSAIFNYDRNEVRAFLISNAIFWLERYHVDGLRMDAIASMLYLDYSRKQGEWIPNQFGGRENLGAVSFLKAVNKEAYENFPDIQTIAEESTAWPMVSRPTTMGGLGFGLKWNMGWMHDTLQYIKNDPVHRKHHHGALTFSLIYAFNENFVLPLSHDEVVYGKGSLIGKMPGDDWQAFANLRALFGYMWGHPGKKLLFMGGEFAQRREWTHEGELEWWVTGLPEHAGMQHWMRDLNRVYRQEPALHRVDFSAEGFEWIDSDNSEMSIIAFLRKTAGEPPIMVVTNFTPVPRQNFLMGVPLRGKWREILNSDAHDYGGSGWGNMGGVDSVPVGAHGRLDSINLNIAPLATMMFRWEGDG